MIRYRYRADISILMIIYRSITNLGHRYGPYAIFSCTHRAGQRLFGEFGIDSGLLDSFPPRYKQWCIFRIGKELREANG